METDLRQRLVAILAADAAGYSRLMAEDEHATAQALDAARTVFRGQIETHQGRVVGMPGDFVLGVFETAAGAATAAIGIQETLRAMASAVPEGRRMLFRIGLHLGDVTEKADGTVYGDGVNVAARLQALAEPGGIMVSDALHGAVQGKVAAEFVDRGAQQVKNIPHPVRAFALRPLAEPAVAPSPPPLAKLRDRRALAWAAVAAAALAIAAAGWRQFAPSAPKSRPAATAAQAALDLPSRPSIAVLPFDNMSGDSDQAYFADGITEDLITDLSKVSGLFVISRNSTFVYKGKARDVRSIARDLGVRYVLEGSVRRSGTDVRVNAQLIDGATGGHLWAERYDGELKNIFALQDKVTRSVVAALSVELNKEDRERVAHRGTENAEAYDVLLKGWQLYLRQTPEDFRAAIIQFKKAAELDPKYGRAYAALAATYWEASRRLWDVAKGFNVQHEAQFQAEQFLQKAMNDPTPLAHQVASAMRLHAQQHDDAIAEAKRAIESDPNDADGYIALASALSFSGKPAEALDQVERAFRLNPHSPPYYYYQRALAQFGMQRLDEAAKTLERALALSPDEYWSQRLLLATYGLLGRSADAAKLLETIKGKDKRQKAFLDPITVRAVAYWHPYANQADAERFAEGLRKSGVPD